MLGGVESDHVGSGRVDGLGRTNVGFDSRCLECGSAFVSERDECWNTGLGLVASTPQEMPVQPQVTKKMRKRGRGKKGKWTGGVGWHDAGWQDAGWQQTEVSASDSSDS